MYEKVVFMSGPIQGSYTAQQIQEIQQMWSTLPDASPQQINSDIKALSKLLASFPPDSGQASALKYALVNLQAAASGGADSGLFIVNAENALAGTISPQLPSILTQEMRTTLQKMLDNMGPASPAQLNGYLTSLTQMLVQAQGMPSSPQQATLVNQLEKAIDGLTAYMGNKQGWAAEEFRNSLQYILGQTPGGASSVG